MIYKKTCGLDHPEDQSVCFALTGRWMIAAANSGLRLEVFCPKDVDVPYTANVRWIARSYPLFDFINYHNEVNLYRQPNNNIISKGADISSLASIGDEGLRYAKGPDGEIVGMKHMGNVAIQKGVVIGSFTSIARGIFRSTIIKEDTKIDRGVCISHNCNIGRRCIIVQGASIMGSVTIGDDCFIGGNAVIRNGISVAKGSMIGMGSVVTRSIENGGFVWAGCPAKRMGVWNGSFDV